MDFVNEPWFGIIFIVLMFGLYIYVKFFLPGHMERKSERTKEKAEESMDVNNFTVTKSRQYLGLFIFLAAIIATGIYFAVAEYIEKREEGTLATVALIFPMFFFFTFMTVRTIRWKIKSTDNGFTYTSSWGFKREFTFREIVKCEKVWETKNHLYCHITVYSEKGKLFSLSETNIGYNMLMKRFALERIPYFEVDKPLL